MICRVHFRHHSKFEIPFSDMRVCNFFFSFCPFVVFTVTCYFFFFDILEKSFCSILSPRLRVKIRTGTVPAVSQRHKKDGVHAESKTAAQLARLFYM